MRPSTLGIIFPICECGMIPVVRRLMHKGMPAYIAVTFILSGPVVNPIVFTATLLAFPNHPEITMARMGLAFAVASAVGGLVYLFVKRNPLRAPKIAMTEVKTHPGFKMALSPHHDSHSHTHARAHSHGISNGHHHAHPKNWRGFFIHAGDEFVDMSKYLVIGALITACIQTFVSRSDLIALGNGSATSYVFMMGFAYVLSLCSTSDSFVASAFSHTFALGPLISFLVLGPMLDFKSTLIFALYLPHPLRDWIKSGDYSTCVCRIMGGELVVVGMTCDNKECNKAESRETKDSSREEEL